MADPNWIDSIVTDEDAHWAAERAKMDDASYEKWAAEHAESLMEEAYQEWAQARMEDGMRHSRRDYDDYLESMVPSE